MPGRIQPSDKVLQQILLRSKRRCALCFLENRVDPRSGSIARIDPKALTADEDNLVFLCADHHRQVDAGRSVTPEELVRARASLYEAMRREEESVTAGQHPWLAYEDHVADLVRAGLSDRLGDFFRLEKHAVVQGCSGVAHAVDLAVQFVLAGLRVSMVFDIKHSRRPIGSEEILRFSAIVDDIGAHKAVFVASGGFSNAATRLAHARRIALMQLDAKAQSLSEAVLDEAGLSSPGPADRPVRRTKGSRRSPHGR